ncbi:phosphatidylinositol 4-phosphate 5-kinase-like protein 1 [Anolis carolinensis]|uniref:phosphatidylinositol 4-phosphate 5-kinase-like protein 1 n=1 Tax=Anolis carolinensis TaxID=28377 RepID=UPI002F2B2141
MRQCSICAFVIRCTHGTRTRRHPTGSLLVVPLQSESREPMRRSHRRAPLMHRIMWRIHEQWQLLGFFEINRDHEFYPLTCMLKQGLRASLQHAMDNWSYLDINRESDFSQVLKQAHEGYEMRTYAGPVFAYFRHFLGTMDLDYQQSLCSEHSYLQFISNSKSSANFFLSHDKHFFLKTQKRREIRFILTNLPKYLAHMERYPHSLLVKFLGIHSIIIPQQKKKYFIIMQSIFYPHERILERYDIKGCQVNRWTDAAPEGSEVIMVFKDLNFGDKTIWLDEQRSWFLRQVELDTQFLKRLHVIDYSILVGIQPLREDERILNKALVNIIARTTMSINQSLRNPSIMTLDGEGTGSMTSFIHRTISSLDQFYKLSPESKTTLHTLLGLYLKHRPSVEVDLDQSLKSETLTRDILTPCIHYDASSASDAEASSSTQPFGATAPSRITWGNISLTDAPFETDRNLRLLPNSRNPLHVVDGPEDRYFLGIIDFFTEYGCRKKLENIWKKIRYGRQSFSTVPPRTYARRLCKWVEEHTE